MQSTKIVVWDAVGNVMWGVRPWEEWPARTRAQLLAEDPEARAHAPSFAELFKDHPVELQHVHSVDELAAAVSDCDVLVLHKTHIPAEVLRTATRLRLIQHLGLDYRGVPIATAREMGIPVAAPPLVNYLAVAEHVWALILNHLKKLPQLRQRMLDRDYRDSWGTHPGLLLAGDQTLGLLGFGEIGRPVSRVARAFGMRTIYWDIVRFPELEAEYGVEYAAWDDVFRRADVLTVQLALNEKTEGIVGAREIGLMKPAALFVNTARGKLVDQAALTAAVRERRIGGAALDVFLEEPLPEDDPLHEFHAQLELDVTLTPHCAWQSPWTWVRDSHGIWLNVLRLLHDEPLEHVV